MKKIRNELVGSSWGLDLNSVKWIWIIYDFCLSRASRFLKVRRGRVKWHVAVKCEQWSMMFPSGMIVRQPTFAKVINKERFFHMHGHSNLKSTDRYSWAPQQRSYSSPFSKNLALSSARLKRTSAQSAQRILNDLLHYLHAAQIKEANVTVSIPHLPNIFT